MKQVIAVVAALGFLGGSSLVHARQFHGGRLETMKLLTADVGWTASESHLFWTTDAGRTWRDITPEVDDDDGIASVFFLNTSTGWVLFSRYDEPQPFFDLASTKDGGRTWSVKEDMLPKLKQKGPDLATHADIFFADAIHGWMNIAVVSSSAFHPGVLLKTEDGGRKWNWATGRSYGSVWFLNPKDGWILSPPQDDLEETHDGGTSWHPPTLLPGPATRGKEPYKYGLPAFADAQHGFLWVNFGDSVTLFASSDGGKTWSPQGPPPELGFAYTFLDSASGGPGYVAAAISKGTLTLTTTAVGATPSGAAAAVHADITKLTDAVTPWQLSFVDKTHGWLLAMTSICEPARTGCSQLLATSDGGAVWEDNTPIKARGLRASLPPTASPKPRSGVRTPQPQHRAPAPPPNPEPLYVSVGTPTHVAFDSTDVLQAPTTPCNTQQAVGFMQDWWNHSPYWDVGVYLLNSPNRHNDGCMSLLWVAQVMQQGWGFWPIWFGLQSSCTNDCPQCTQFIPPDPTDAYNAGVSEAQTAVAQAGLLGLPSGIIYKDIENYTPDNPKTGTCSPPVQAYLSGWDTEMHTLAGAGSAGVYGNPCPASQDFVNASPEPDDIWMAKADNRRTIWGLSTLGCSVPDSGSQWWTNNQRMHQFLTNTSGNYGGFAYSPIDLDIDDAAVLANKGTKSYSWEPAISTLPCAPPEASRELQGINNSLSSVGEDRSQTTACLYSGTVQDFGPAGVFWSDARAINSQGQIVGAVQTASGQPVQGFLYNGAFAYFSYPGAYYTFPLGINDDGMIVGYWCPQSNGNCGGFLYDGNNFTAVEYSGATCTVLAGINGYNLAVGWHFFDSYGGCAYLDGTSWAPFLYSQGQILDLDPDILDAWAINNNGQLAADSNTYGFGIYNLNGGSFTTAATSSMEIDDALDLAGNSSIVPVEQ